LFELTPHSLLEVAGGRGESKLMIPASTPSRPPEHLSSTTIKLLSSSKQHDAQFPQDEVNPNLHLDDM
jgi:hypothetical protein